MPQISHAADRLIDAIAQVNSPVCVGLDPVIDCLPRAMRPSKCDLCSFSSAVEDFSIEVLRAIRGVVPCVKIQSACFERYGSAGVASLESVLNTARDEGFQVILDAKRGDIGVSSKHYASGIFDKQDAPDWVTINPLFGEDGILPFLQPGRGVFALVKTSNQTADSLQGLELKDQRSVSEAIGDLIAAIGKNCVGKHGYSALGAVVGATKPDSMKSLRNRMPNQIFLVPGYGAQGGTVDDVLSCFNEDRMGAIITASRSVIYAFDENDSKWTTAVSDAAAKFAGEITQAVGIRS